MIKKFIGVVASIFMAVGLLSFVSPATANACPRDVVLAVGGYGGGNGAPFGNRGEILVKYSGNLNAMEEGISVLKNHVDWWNANCGGTRLILTGHSQGSAIVHVYLTRHGHTIKHKAHAVLFSDPKMKDTGESNGLFMLGGNPIAGTDDNFGGVPTASVCYLDDVICNRGAGWAGYLFRGAHGNYNFDARHYDKVVGSIYY